MKTTQLFLIFLIFSAFTACNRDEGDTTKPAVVLHEPTEEQAFALGGTLRLDMDLSDNEALDQYKVEIHWAAGHTHTRAEEASIYQNVWNDAAGLKSKHVRHDIALPTDAASGDYHLMVYCTDASGNETHAVCTIELH